MLTVEVRQSDSGTISLIGPDEREISIQPTLEAIRELGLENDIGQIRKIPLSILSKEDQEHYQQWLDRQLIIARMMSHPRPYLHGIWEHQFAEGKRHIRFVFDLREARVLSIQVLTAVAEWRDATLNEFNHVEDSIFDNFSLSNPDELGLERSDDLPAWVSQLA